MAKTKNISKRPVLQKMKPCIIGLFTYAGQRFKLLHTHFQTLLTNYFPQHTQHCTNYSIIAPLLTTTTSTTRQHTNTKPFFTYTQALHCTASSHSLTLTLSLPLPPTTPTTTPTPSHPSIHHISYITSWLSCLHHRWDILYFKAKLTASRLPPLKEFC